MPVGRREISVSKLLWERQSFDNDRFVPPPNAKSLFGTATFILRSRFRRKNPPEALPATVQTAHAGVSRELAFIPQGPPVDGA